ncbi:MAG TPA: dihydrodipicolinate synthase family protein [Anaerolineae bacterium]|nr:dihydrodipicolinate synthase family protein [Anaerolineae bacterium]
MKTLDLRGIIPAIVTPMLPDGTFDRASMQRYIEWLVPQGPIALAVNVDTGEGPHLSFDERRTVLETVRQAVNGRCLIVAGIGGPATAHAVANAKQARDAGADALLVFPIPAYLGQPLNPEIPYQYHAAIADASDLPIILFQLQPALGGLNYTADVLHRLIEIPHVVGIKEASFDAMRFVQIKNILDSASRRITFLTGNDNFIYESFLLGAEGALLGFATLGTREHVQMLDAVRRCDYATAEKIGQQLQELANVIFALPVTDYRARTKEALKLLGVIDHTTVRPPLLPVNESERTAIQRALQHAGML